jgi:DNA-binding MarR family transcriptional regulator
MAPTNETLRFMRVLWGLVHGLDVRSKWMERNLGVTGPQRLVVRMVGREPGIAASQIATNLDLHPSTLTGILSRLEKRGYLVRDVDPSDRRRARFRLTPRGQRIDRERKGTVEATVRKVLARASGQSVSQTEELLQLLITELSKDES